MAASKTLSTYSRDPRLPSPSTYDRQECLNVIDDFLRYLTERVSTLQKDWILRPPASGWPQITPELFAPLGKTVEVVDLLAQMPYICMPDQGKPWALHHTWPVIIRNTRLIDFSHERVCKALATQESQQQAEQSLAYIQQPLLDLPPWVVCLTTGMVHGDYLLLDTSDGTVTRYMVVDGFRDPDYAQDDLRSWRNKCNERTMPVQEYFLMMKIDMDALLWIPLIRDKTADVMFPADSPGEAAYLKALYIKHGWLWPNHFQREACRQDLIDWDEAGRDYRIRQIEMWKLSGRV